MAFDDFNWLNEPKHWELKAGELSVITDAQTDFWRETFYHFTRHSGHVFGRETTQEFTFQLCIEADFTALYDQAGIMLRVDETRWLKAGIEFSDGQPMIGSVLTNGQSDWATAPYHDNPAKFWLRLTLADGCLRLQYSSDGERWPLLRLSPFAASDRYFVGAMCCTPERAGLKVRFSQATMTAPLNKPLHDLT